MPLYSLSLEGFGDLVDIGDFGIRMFGTVQAAKYHAGLETTFELLAKFPRIGLPAYDLHEGLYRFPHKSHVIFYTLHPDLIRIVRVLHGRADFKRIF